jgi:hypothetical protein
MIYCIDTSSLVDAWVRYYPPASFPSLWEKIEALIDAGTLISSEEVLRELERQEDELLAWAKQRNHLFQPVDEAVQKMTMEILNQCPKLVNINKHRSEGDPFVIATAQLYGAIVVTGEHPTNKINKPKIPDVCRLLNIPLINTLGLIQSEKWTF